MKKSPTYDLLSQPCVPVLDESGSSKVVGLREAILNANAFRGISPERPLAYAALIRTLTALVIDVYQPRSPQDVRRLWDMGRFGPEALDDYLAQWGHRFDLFHPEYPFAQVAGLAPAGAGGFRPASALRLDTAAGNNVPLFSATTEGDAVVLTPHEAFLGLLEVLAFDTAAIKSGAAGDPEVKGGKTSGNPTGPVGQLGLVMPEGINLLHTLLLNVPTIDRLRDDDLPIWRRDLTPAWETRQPRGIREHLTWASRRIRLVPHEGSTEAGTVLIAAGDRLSFMPPIEPHCRWRDSTRREAVAKSPVRWRSGQSAWRGLDSLLALHDLGGFESSILLHQIASADWLPVDYPLSVRCLGVAYGNMSAVIEDVFVDSVPLPMAALSTEDEAILREALQDVAVRAEGVRRALNGLADNLREAVGGEKIPWDKGSHPGDDAMALLTTPTMRLLRGLQTDPERMEEGLLAWDRAVSRIAWSVATPLLEGAPPSAFVGRPARSTKRIVRLADAEAWFRHALRNALTHVTAHRNQQIEKEAS